jgi:uncharacterized membrane protein YfcA
MKKSKQIGALAAGAGAGIVNGLFGAGGGMVLIPLLTLLTPVEEEDVFGVSIATILPICLVSIVATGLSSSIPWREALPWLPGSAAGGILAGILEKKIPVCWLHRSLGLLILWGGFRYLC